MSFPSGASSNSSTTSCESVAAGVQLRFTYGVPLSSFSAANGCVRKLATNPGRSVAGTDDSKSLLLGGDLKFYTRDEVFIRAGAGVATTDLGGGMGSSERFWGPGALFAVGYEWFQLRDIGLFAELESLVWKPVSKSIMGVDVDPKLTVLNIQVNFGITWY